MKVSVFCIRVLLVGILGMVNTYDQVAFSDLSIANEVQGVDSRL